MRTLRALALAVCLAGCESAPPTPTPNATPSEGSVAAPQTQGAPASKAVEIPPAPSDDSTEDFDHLVRDTPRSDWIAKWGPPTESLELSMAEPLPEFRVELYNDFKPDDPATAKVKVTEDTWDLDGYYFTLWSVDRDGDKVAIQAMSYSDGVEF